LLGLVRGGGRQWRLATALCSCAVLAGGVGCGDSDDGQGRQAAAGDGGRAAETAPASKDAGSSGDRSADGSGDGTSTAAIEPFDAEPGSPQHAVEGAVKRIASALGDRDRPKLDSVEDVCGLMSEAALEQIARTTYSSESAREAIGEAAACRQSVGLFLERGRRDGVLRRPFGTIVDVNLNADGTSATATLSSPGVSDRSVPLVKERDGWKLDAAQP
jgi:hypothetical protein